MPRAKGMKTGSGRRAPAPPPRVLFIGTGRAAHGLGRAFSAAGMEVAGFWSRSGKKVTGHRSFSGGLDGACGRADVILICVSDRAIGEVAERLAAECRSLKGRVAAHVSGALGADVLDVLRGRGAAVAALHPFFSFSPGVEPSLADIPFSLEGDPAAVAFLKKCFAPSGMKIAELGDRNRALYHAAAVFCANFTVGMQMAADIMLRQLGVGETDARGMISALLLSVARNISSKGPRDALTGPVARRDLPTIRAHVAALREKCPRLLEPYAVISLLIAEYSAAGGDEGFMKGLREAVEGCL